MATMNPAAVAVFFDKVLVSLGKKTVWLTTPLQQDRSRSFWSKVGLFILQINWLGKLKVYKFGKNALLFLCPYITICGWSFLNEPDVVVEALIGLCNTGPPMSVVFENANFEVCTPCNKSHHVHCRGWNTGKYIHRRKPPSNIVLVQINSNEFRSWGITCRYL